jgi:hypothetical protein
MNDRVDKMLANDPLIGRTVLGRFEVLRPLARGGMGVLYLARTLGAKGFVKPVVVKRLSTDTTDEMQKMFVREAQVMAHLSHPNIVQAIDFNREGIVAGKNEFAADDLSATLVNVVKHHPTRLDVLRPDAPTALADVVEHGLEKVPSLRFATAQALATALRASRGADPQRVREAMVAQIRRDFFDPRLIESMAGSDLQTLASAWQSEPTPRPSITSVPVAPDARATLPEVRPARARPVAETLPAPAPAREQPTHTQSSGAVSSQPEPSSSSVLQGAERGADKSAGMNGATWAAVFAAVAALSAAGLVLYRSQSAPAQQGFVIVEANQSASADAQSAVSAQESEDASASEEDGASARRASVPTSANRDEAPRLTAQFARHLAELEACAREHRDERAEIEAIRFVLDRSGAVLRAELQPESAAQSALGACVLGVAQRARFGPMESGVTFRLPVALRVR